MAWSGYGVPGAGSTAAPPSSSFEEASSNTWSPIVCNRIACLAVFSGFGLSVFNTFGVQLLPRGGNYYFGVFSSSERGRSSMNMQSSNTPVEAEHCEVAHVRQISGDDYARANDTRNSFGCHRIIRRFWEGVVKLHWQPLAEFSAAFRS